MDERKRNILIIAATTAAVVLMVVANIAFILMHPAGTEDQDKAAASDVKAETSTSTPAVRHQKPLEVCEKLAPKAAATYTSPSARLTTSAYRNASPASASAPCTVCTTAASGCRRT